MEECAILGMDAVMNTYNRFPVVLERGEGVYVFDSNGKKYLDFVAGIAVNSLGHAHPKLVEAIRSQAGKLIHVSNLYWSRPMAELAARLVESGPFDKAFFCNSGAEAIEGCLKLARKYAYLRHPGRTGIVSMKNSFHGRTLAAVTATGQIKYQQGLGPLFPDVSYAQFNDLPSLEAAVSEKTCAVLIEPIQGEGGIMPADKAFLEGARKICDDMDICLIFDEVQCGAGRAGTFFAFERHGVAPDAAALAKGLAGGVPIGAVLARKGFSEAFSPGDHASTFGGNALAAAAGNVVAAELLDNGLLGHVERMGARLADKLSGLKAKFPDLVKDVRGIGLMQGMEMFSPVSGIISQCMEDGLLLVNAGAFVIRFVPPLVVGEQEIDDCVRILEEALLRLKNGRYTE